MTVPRNMRPIDPIVHLRRAPAFISTGVLAGLAHWTVLFLLVEYAGLAPLLANIAAWACAFVVSFTGHFRFTFADKTPDAWRGAWRFLFVSVIGFLINEAAFAGLLAWHVHYTLAIVAAMALAAVSTYLLSANWAFDSK
jgi:putative flippase GtrA